MPLDRESRRAAAQQEILQACWSLAGEHGLSGFTLRQVAAAVGIRAPSLYSYFPSKSAMYDAMFRTGAESFAAAMAQVGTRGDRRDRLRAAARAYLAFCVEDPVRYQLLFQRSVPGFAPSPEAYAPAIATYDYLRRAFADLGITRPRDLDLWTALVAGLAAQQLANDPVGRRWTRLVSQSVDMYLAHVAAPRTSAGRKETAP